MSESDTLALKNFRDENRLYHNEDIAWVRLAQLLIYSRLQKVINAVYYSHITFYAY